MKHLSALLLLIAVCCSSVSAQMPACCAPPPKAHGFLALTTTEAFMKAHESPEPFNYADKRGSDITYNTPDGKTGRAYYVPASEATTRALIIFHEWWGLNDYIRREADRWQDSLGAVDVYAIDLYDGAVATTPEEAGRLMQGLDKRRTDAIIQGMLVKVGRDPMIAMLGWCMGGSYAFRGAVLAGKQANGCVMYYGFPEEDGKKIAPLKTDVFYIWASRDKFITQDKVQGFKAAVETTGHKFTLATYDADHAFANPSNPHYDAVSAASAQRMAVPFLRRMLAMD